MSDPIPSTAGDCAHWLLTGRGRLVCALLAGALTVLATFRLPPEMRTVISFDAASVIYLGLFYILLSGITTEHSTGSHSRYELRGAITLSLSSCCRW